MKLPVNSYNVFQEQGKMLSSNALGKMTTKRLINLLTIHNSEAVGELTHSESVSATQKTNHSAGELLNTHKFLNTLL